VALEVVVAQEVLDSLDNQVDRDNLDSQGKEVDQEVQE